MKFYISMCTRRHNYVIHYPGPVEYQSLSSIPIRKPKVKKDRLWSELGRSASRMVFEGTEGATV